MARKRSSGTSDGRRINPLRVVLITGAVLLALLVVVLLVGKSSIQSWLRGDEFRQWLVKRAAIELKSEVDLAEMKWQGSEVYTDHFIATGYEDASIAKLELEGVRAKAGGIRDGAFRIPEVTVNRFNLEFSDRRKKRPREVAVLDSDEPVGPAVPGWLARYLPNRAEVGEISLSSAQVIVKKPDGTTPFFMNGVRATVVPDFRTAIWEIEGRGGKIAIPDQPEIQLKDLGMRWRQTELFIDRCSLGIYDGGHVDGSGEISFAGEGNFDLELILSSIDVDDLVEGEWKDRLGGTIEGPVTITGRPGAFVYEGTMNVSDAIIESISVLSLVAEYTRNDQFKHLTLSEAKTDFRREGDRIALTNLVLQSDGLLRVEGNLDMVGDSLNGVFRVGVTPGTLRWIPGAERTVFTEDEGGFLWAPLTLSGTVDEPKEDLSRRLIAAAGEEILKGLPEGLLNEAQKFLNPGEGTPSPGGLLEQGKPLLDLLSPFLKRP